MGSSNAKPSIHDLIKLKPRRLSKKPMCVYLTESLYSDLKVIAAENGLSASFIIDKLIEDFIKEVLNERK